MGRFQSCKPVVERALRRCFYDAVLELYEGHGSSDTVTAVTLEGTLTLTINKAETLLIRLNEVAQRAEEITADDCVQNTAEKDHADCSNDNKEQSVSERKRKQDVLGGNKEEEKPCIKTKEMKVESACIELHGLTGGEIPVKREDACSKPGASWQTSQSPETKQVEVTQSESEACVTVQPTAVKREPEESPFVSAFLASPGPRESKIEQWGSTETVTDSRVPLTASPKEIDLSLPVKVKKEPVVESILIEDTEEDSSTDTGRQTCSSYSSVPQASPVHSLWHKRPHGTKQHSHPHRKYHSHGKHYSNRHGMDTADPHQMAMLLERKDCPLCGEVLHSRRELKSHLHAHRHALRATCSVCHANTLTLDALLLHLSAMHSPRTLPLSATATSSTLLGQALVPTLPYGHAPMSAIASLVSMAACQAGPSSSAFLGAGASMVGGVSSLMEQIMACHSILPCPICQMLCSSRHHLATHLTLMHGISSPGGPGEGQEGVVDDGGAEAPAEGKPDSDTEGSLAANFSCFDCSLEFSSQTLFSQHCLMQHSSTSVVSQGSCSVCHRAFDTWKALHSHYLAAHAITNFCDRCKMGFVSATELKTHYDSMHAAPEARGLTFICDICNKGFYSQSQCSAHKRSHISEKSFACQVCGSAFFKRGDLSKHFRTVHAPNRVFACRFCGKRGTRMDNMRSHVKSHGKHMTRDEVLSFIEEVKS